MTTPASQTLPWLIVFLMLVVALVYFIRRAATLQREMALRLDELTRELNISRSELELLRNEKSAGDSSLAVMQTKLDEERKSAREKIALLEQAEDRLGKEFENLANRIFEEKHLKFTEVSKTGVEALLTPMREQLTDFRKRVEDVYDNENKERASLRTEIQSLKSLNERIGADALNLTRALKGDSKARGAWGEMKLERLLEESGLAKGCEYDVQASHRNEDGQRFQPDVVLHLPEKKDVVIDSKVSLVAYEQYYTAETDDERQRQLRTHIASLRTHFNGLSAKNYDELIGVNSLDLVIMFVPIEPALLLAFEHEPNLFTEAFNRRILLVSPSTLMATLQIIHNIWRYEYQNRNAQTIAAEAGKLHDQFVSFVDALEKVGDQIKKAGESYDTAHKRLTSGRGNLVGRTQNLKILGAKAKKSISGELLEAAAENDDELVLVTDETNTDEEMVS
ncbi:MAG: DNA recombination protein RmuC [Deltaproteobacteria bacterium]